MTWDYIGQEWAVSLLQKHVQFGNVRQAYLFTGPQGIGRRTLALRFARVLNCQNPPSPGEVCGSCRACKGIAKGEQADLAIIRRGEDRTRILIDQVRELQHSLALAPYESKYRVGLLLNFEQATEDAQNALLKVLEEPPDRVVLMLTAESAENLLPTISSRCEQVRLRPLKPAALAQSLQGLEGITAALPAQLASISGGCPGTAIRLGGSSDLFRKRQERFEAGLELIRSSLVERFRYADKTSRHSEKMNQSREELRVLLQTWTGLWRDIYLANSGAQAYIYNIDFNEEISKIAERIPSVDALGCLKELNSGLWKLDNNANLRLLLEVILIGWPELAGGV